MMMMHLSFFVCVCSCLLAPGGSCSLSRTGTLCRPDLCPQDEKHVGCFSNKTFGKKCHGQAQIITVNGALKQGIIDRINVIRNFVASGAGNFSVAARMPTMGWCTDLQRLADLQARQCEDEETRFCANTEKYKYVATIVMKRDYGILRQSNYIQKTIFNDFLPLLMMDGLDCRMLKDQRIKAIRAGSCVGHYVPLIEDHGNKMGCAVSLKRHPVDPEMRREKGARGTAVELILICHFSRANVNNMNHYEVGEIPTEKCATGPNQMYMFLCSTDEVVDPNSLESETNFTLQNDFEP